MHCINHPQKETTIHCLECSTPLCDQCAAPQQGNAFLCRKCVTRRAAQETVQGIALRQQDSIQREFKSEAKRKKNALLIRLALISLIAMIIGVNFYLYFHFSTPRWSDENSEEHPAMSVIILDAALQDYANDHQGKYPQRLDKLRGTYIEPEALTPENLRNIDYTRTSAYTYELRLSDSNGATGSDLIFTEIGSDEAQQ